MAQKHQIVITLKKLLKQHDLKYEDVAKELNLSEGSVKRLFSNQDFSLDRLDQICGLMDLDISELIQSMQQQQAQTDSLSSDQEKELVSNTKLLLTTHLLMNNWKVDDILSYYKIEHLEMIQYLARLDKMKIIDLLPGNRTKLKISRNFKWLEKGPIETFFKLNVQNEFLDSDFSNNGEIRIFLSGMISRSANSELIRRIKKLANIFEEAHLEDKGSELSEKFGTSIVLALRPWDITLFEQYRRSGTHKGF